MLIIPTSLQFFSREWICSSGFEIQGDPRNCFLFATAPSALSSILSNLSFNSSGHVGAMRWQSANGVWQIHKNALTKLCILFILFPSLLFIHRYIVAQGKISIVRGHSGEKQNPKRLAKYFQVSSYFSSFASSSFSRSAILSWSAEWVPMVSPAYSLGKARSTSTPGTICCYICFGESYFKVVVLRHLQSSSWCHAFQESIAVVLRCFVLFLVPNCNMWNSQHQSFAMAASLKKVHPTCAMTRGVLEEQKSPKIGRTPKPSKPHPVASVAKPIGPSHLHHTSPTRAPSSDAVAGKPRGLWHGFITNKIPTASVFRTKVKFMVNHIMSVISYLYERVHARVYVSACNTGTMMQCVAMMRCGIAAASVLLHLRHIEA